MHALKVLLVSVLIVSIGGAPADVTTTTEAEFEIDVGEDPEPFNPEQYKQYLNDLKCMDIIINHGGTKTPEVPSGSIYKPTTTTTERTADKTPEYEDTSGDEEDEEDAFGDKEEDTTQKKSAEVGNYDEGAKVIKTKRSTGLSEVVASENSTSEENTTDVCTAPLTYKWDSYDWYQILVDNGGAPGNLNVSGPKPNLTKAEDPCTRPLKFGSPLHDKVWYITKSLQPDKRVYREEKVSLRFPDTPHEFLDIKGLLVWSPPEEKHRSYHISYRKDDSGLYVLLERDQRCHFTDPIHTSGIKCENTVPIECDCENGFEVCANPGIIPISLSPGLSASLIGK